MIEKHHSRDPLEQDWEESPRKRMRASGDTEDGHSKRDGRERSRSSHGHEHIHDDRDKDKSITIASTARMAPQAVAPFFAKHIPVSYAPMGDPNDKRTNPDNLRDPNTKYCYRHRPDLLCRRQADEPSMDKLQKELEALSQEDRQGIVQVWSLFSAAPSKHRNLMLQGILAQCCVPQLSFLSANVRKLSGIDFLSELPAEVAFRILCFLDTTSLCKAAQVSRKWRQLADDDVVWHRMCEQHIDRKCTRCGWGLPLLERKRLREYKRQVQLRASGQGSEDPSSSHVPGHNNNPSPTKSDSNTVPATDIEKSVDGSLSPVAIQRPPLCPTQSEFERKTRPWKDVYKDRFKVGTNWKHGRSKLEILRGHTNGVMAMDMWDNILATGSYDDTIKIWDMDTGKELRTLRGHTMGVRCLQIGATTLVSGSLDNELRSWNWRTGQCIGRWKGHSDGVIGLHHNSEIMVSGSVDRTARVWNLKTKSVTVLRGHTDWVNAVRIDTPSHTVFTASDDCTIKLWDLETNRCIKTYEGHVCQVQQVVILPPEFDAEEEDPEESSVPASPMSDHTGSSFTGHGTGSPVLSNRYLPPNQCQPTAQLDDPFADFAEDRPRPPRYMLTSALDSTIRLWEIATGRCVRTYFGHLEGVWALAADTLRIVSGAEDRMVKVWDPRSGKCERTFTGHRGPVTCIALSDSRMVSAGEDGDIRVYSFSD